MSKRFLNPSVCAVPPSGIRRFFDIAGTMEGAISLGVGEPDFVTPWHIRDAAIRSLEHGETQYTANRGLLSLRKQIAYYLEKRFSVSYDPAEEIMVTVGGSEGIDLALRVCVSPGDEVLVPDPGYVSYAPCVTFAGGVPVPVRTYAKDDFRMTAEELEKRITPKTKMLIFPFPNNPTGAVMKKEHMQQIAAVVCRHDLVVLTDEIYAELTYGEEPVSLASLPGMRERCILLSGFSKAFAMTGWRIGYACAPGEILGMMNKVHQYTIMCAPRQGQVAAEEALRRGREDGYQDVIRMRESYNQRRRLMLHSLREMGLECFEPQGAFYCFPKVSHLGKSSEEFCTELLQQYKVVCVPGGAFGESGEGHIRCCYATGTEQMEEAFRRMRNYIESISGGK